MSNLASSLIIHKRINTTLAKAKELRKFVEPLITRAKEDTTHSRRMVFSYLNNKETVKILFNEVADRIADRPGGYTRIIKTGQRLGDNAEMCLMELVDFNDLYTKEPVEKKAKTRRSRRGSKSAKETNETPAAAATKEEVKETESIPGKEGGEAQEEKEEKEVKAKAKAKPEAKSKSKPAAETKSAKSEKGKTKAAEKKPAAKSDKKSKGTKKGGK